MRINVLNLIWNLYSHRYRPQIVAFFHIKRTVPAVSRFFFFFLRYINANYYFIAIRGLERDKIVLF